MGDVYFEYESAVQRVKSIDKRLFFLQALQKGQNQKEKENAAAEVVTLNEDRAKNAAIVDALEKRLVEHEQSQIQN